MAMDSITDVRVGLATAADTIAGLTGISYVPDKIEGPTFVAGQVEQDFDQSMGRGIDVLVVKCRLYTSRSDAKVGQSALDDYLVGTGAKSIKTALETDRTLGGACSSMRVERQDGYGIYDIGGTEYFGAEFTVRVWG